MMWKQMMLCGVAYNPKMNQKLFIKDVVIHIFRASETLFYDENIRKKCCSFFFKYKIKLTVLNNDHDPVTLTINFNEKTIKLSKRKSL